MANTHGGARKGAGRPPKPERQKMIESLGKYSEKAHQQLEKAVEKGEIWAIKLYFEYLVGKPTESKELSIDQSTVVSQGRSLKDMVEFNKTKDTSGKSE